MPVISTWIELEVDISEVQLGFLYLILIYTPKYSSGLIGLALVCIDGEFLGGGNMLPKKDPVQISDNYYRLMICSSTSRSRPNAGLKAPFSMTL